MADTYSKLADASSGSQWDWKVVRSPDPTSGVSPSVYAVVQWESIADLLVSLLNANEGS